MRNAFMELMGFIASLSFVRTNRVTTPYGTTMVDIKQEQKGQFLAISE
jgi:hypothetical protein